MLKGCDPNAAEVNTASVGAGPNACPAQSLTEAQWQEQRDKYKDVACPKAVTGASCPFQADGKCFYSHSANVIAKAKSKPMPEAKAEQRAAKVKMIREMETPKETKAKKERRTGKKADQS